MAKIRKRGNAYQIDYFDPEGKRVRKSFKKRKDAEAELGKRVSLIAEDRYLDVKKDYKTKFGELLEKYTENYQNQSAFKTFKKYCLEDLRSYYGEGTLLSNIRYVDLETYRNYLRQEPTKNGNVRKDASVNRAMACLRHMFSKATEWDMIERNPFDRGKPLIVKENNKRYRYLDEDEISRLLESCPNDHTRDAVTCVLHTGMRRQEVLGLKWKQIRGDFIYLEKTKTDEARQIPINDDLAELFKAIRKRNQLTTEYLFCDKQGRPFKDLKTSFRAACRKAGIEDFRFHDLRHTFASHFVMRGGSLKDLQEILGHRSMVMTLRYAHLSQEHKKRAINLMNGLTAPQSGNCHKTVTLPHVSKTATT